MAVGEKKKKTTVKLLTLLSGDIQAGAEHVHLRAPAAGAAPGSDPAVLHERPGAPHPPR